MRKLLLFLLSLVGLLAAAALIVPGLVDWNAYKGDVAAAVEAATGRRLTIKGDLQFTVLPAPRLSVRDARLANMAGASTPEMVRLKSLEVRIRFLPLLKGRIEVESVTLVEPVIELEVLADGRANWQFAPPPQNGKKARIPGAPVPAPAPSGGVAESAAAAIRLDSLKITRGTLIYRDAGGTNERIDQMNLEIAARSLMGPFRVKGTLAVQGVPLALQATVGRLREGAPSPVSIKLNLTAAEAEAELVGTLAGIGTEPRISGKLRLVGKDLGRLAAAVGLGEGGGALPPWLGQPFSLESRVKASAKDLSIGDIVLSFGGMRATGDISAAFGRRIAAKVKLEIIRIDLDRWLAMPERAGGATPPGGRETARSDAAAGGAAGPASPVAAESAGFALPPNVDGSLNVMVKAVTYKGGIIRDVRVDAALSEGELTLNQASLRLPGEAEVSLFGFLDAEGGRPRFDGTLEARADNLRAVLSWLGLDVTRISADRLRKFSLTGKVRLAGGLAHLLDARMRLDSSRLNGGITVALRRRLAFGANIDLDHLNLDAYRPRERAGEAKAGADQAAAAAGAQPPSAASSAAPAVVPRAPLAFLNDFDANLKLRIGSLNIERTAARDIRFDGTLSGGTLKLRQAVIGNLAGTSARIAGTLTNFDRFPVFKGTFRVDSKDLTGLLRVAGIDTPVPPRRYGALKLRGRADGGADRVKLDAEMTIAGATVKLKGEVLALGKTPRVELTLGASHPELSRLAPLLGLDFGTGKRRLGPFGLTIELNGGMGAVSVDTKVKLAGIDFGIRGTVNQPMTAATVDLAVSASHPSFVTLMRLFDPGYRPAARKLGAVRLSARVKGGAGTLELAGLKAGIGRLEVTGDASLALLGRRPKLTATLAAGEIDVDSFLAPVTAPPPDPAARRTPPRPGVPAPAKPGTPVADAARFSAMPLGLAALGGFDAELSIAAKGLTYAGFRVDQPRIEATLADNVLTLRNLGGRMFDGAFALSGTLDARRIPVLSGTVRVSKANVGKALFQAAAFDIAGGILDFEMTATAKGRSPRALISSLGGEGRITVRDGVAKGFDLTAVSDRLKNLRRATDFLRLFDTAMGGGETRFSTVDGSFRIAKGVLRTDDLRLVAKAGEGRATGFADLPRWKMDFTAEFRLTEHPAAPPFGMRAYGALDDPKRVFKFDKLQSYLLRRGISSGLQRLLRKAVPRVAAPRPTQPQQVQPQQVQPQPQPQRVKPKDILRGLLEGILTR